MAIQSGFFNSVNGDRRYDAKWFAQYFASFIANGVFPNPSTGLQVVEGDNMRTVVKAGKGWINGYFIINDNDYVLQHDNADGVLKRIDRVVMRLNNLTRQIEIAVKKGNFASSPVAPSLQRDGDYYELALADVLINNGATQITQANITDTRLNNDLCGVVHGIVNQVDTTTLFNQYQSWYEQTIGEADIAFSNMQQRLEQDFSDWFAEVQTILDGDVAGNLTNRIINIESKIGTDTLQTQSQTLTGAINEVFQVGNNVKNDTVDALLSVDNNLPITNQSSWTTIISKIGNISTGKKWATGNVTSTSDTYVFRELNSNIQWAKVVVSNLQFKPNYVILLPIAGGISPILFVSEGSGTYNGRLMTTSYYTYMFQNNENLYNWSTGISLPADAPNKNYKYIAFE